MIQMSPLIHGVSAQEPSLPAHIKMGLYNFNVYKRRTVARTHKDGIVQFQGIRKAHSYSLVPEALCCVPYQLLSTVSTQEDRKRPDMAEKLLTGTFSINSNN